MGNQVGTPLTFWQKWSFIVEIEGVKVGGFTKCSEIKQTAGIVVQREGGSRLPVDKSTSTIDSEKLTLTRGASTNDELYQWWLNVKAGVQDKRNVSIVKQATDGSEIGRRNIKNAVIASYAEGDFDGTNNNENAMETVELEWIDVDRKE